MAEEKVIIVKTEGESKIPKGIGYSILVIGILAVIILVWYYFIRNPCDEGETWDPVTQKCSPKDDDNGGNGDDDGTVISPFGTPDFHKDYSEFPRDIEWIFGDDGWADSYELELISGSVKFRKEAWLFAPDRLEISKMDSNGNWIFLWGKDYWGVHDDIIADIQISLARSGIKGFKFHLRYGYFINANVSTL